jgi:hypothetical protein
MMEVLYPRGCGREVYGSSVSPCVLVLEACGRKSSCARTYSGLTGLPCGRS